MHPSAAQFKKLLRNAYQAIPDDEPSKDERRLLISCVVASAEAVERLEKVLREVIAPALNAVMQNAGTATPAKAEAAPEAQEAEAAPAPEAEMPPLRATTTVTGPATPPAAATTSKVVTAPSANGTTSTAS